MQKPDGGGMTEFLKPLNDKLAQANNMSEGKRSDFFNHLKAASESLSALIWIAYTGKGCGKQKLLLLTSYFPIFNINLASKQQLFALIFSGMSMPIGHVEECWQSAEFYNNKVLITYHFIFIHPLFLKLTGVVTCD